MNPSFSNAWADVPTKRKIVGFLMFLSLIPSEQKIMDFMFGKGWDE